MVASHCGFDIRFIFCKGGRIEDHEIESTSLLFILAKKIEGIAVLSFKFESVEHCGGFSSFEGACILIDGKTGGGSCFQCGERESPLIREDIKDSTMGRHFSDFCVVLDLIEIKTGFMTLHKIDGKFDSSELYLGFERFRSGEDCFVYGKTFKRSDLSVITKKNSLREKSILEDSTDHLLSITHRFGQGLNDDVGREKIDDKSRESIGF